jgi:tripeptide aminopeptidase
VPGTNVVPERCTVRGEARSVSADAVESVVAEMVDHLYDAANDPECECDVDVVVERVFEGYRHRPGARPVAVAEAALRACGYEPTRITTGGGSDANALEAAGLPCTNLANGTERNHEPTERVAVAALEGMLDVAFALLDAAADEAAGGGSGPGGAGARDR